MPACRRGRAAALAAVPALLLLLRGPTGGPGFAGTLPGRRGCGVARASAALSPEEWVLDQWKEEAARCWGLDDAGLVVGMIPEMAAPDPSAKKSRERPWKRLEGDQQSTYRGPSLETEADNVIYYYTGKDARDSDDVCQKDYTMAVKHFLPKDGQGIVLDLGCGDGLMARRFAQSALFSRVFGVDLSRRQLERARRAAEVERTSPEDGLFLARADAADLPFRSMLVDYVWWGLGAHIVEDLEGALASILRILRPGGRLLATARSDIFPPKILESLAKEAGFTEVKLTVPRFTVVALQARRP